MDKIIDVFRVRKRKVWCSMFNFGRKKSFFEKGVDGVLNGLAAVGDVVIATGEVIGDAVDAITTPSQKREITIVHERPVIERRVVINTTPIARVEVPVNQELYTRTELSPAYNLFTVTVTRRVDGKYIVVCRDSIYRVKAENSYIYLETAMSQAEAYQRRIRNGWYD